MATHRVRVTQEPDVVRKVTGAELLDLHRMGVLHSYEHTDKASDVLGGTVETPAKWKAPERTTPAAPAAGTDNTGKA